MKYLSLLLLLFVFSSGYSQGMDENNKFRLAQSYEAGGNYSKSLELYTELCRFFPGNDTYFDGFIRSAVQLKKIDLVTIAIKQKLFIRPNDIDLWTNLAVYYYKLDNIDSMNICLGNVLKICKSNIAGYRQVSAILTENRMIDKAIEILKAGFTESNDKISFIYDLITLYALVMNYEKSNEMMIELLVRESEQYSYVQNRLSVFLSKQDALTSSLSAFKTAAERYDNTGIYRTYYWLLFEARRFREAFELVIKLDEKNNQKGNEILIYAQKAYHENEFDAAIEAYKYLLIKFEKLPEIKANAILGLARTNYKQLNKEFYSKNETWKILKGFIKSENAIAEAALNNYLKIIQEYPGSFYVNEAKYSIAEIKFRFFNDISGARDLLIPIIREKSGSDFYRKSRLLFTDIYKAEQKFSEAFNFNLESIRENSLTEEEKRICKFQNAELLLVQGLIDSALTVLDEIVMKKNEDLSNEALNYLFLINDNSDNKELIKKYFQGKMELELKDFIKAEQIFKEITTEKAESEISVLSYLNLSDLAIFRSDYSMAIANLQYIISMKDKTIYGDRALFGLGGLYLHGMKNKELAFKYYEQILVDYPNSLFVSSTRKLIEEYKLNQYN